MTDRFKLKSGDLSRYAFACGYVQSHICNGLELNLKHSGGSVYDLRGYTQHPFAREFWDTFDTIGEARKAYRQRKAQMRAGRFNASK